VVKTRSDTRVISSKITNNLVHIANYNFCRIHNTLRCTPAMEAGITNRLWNMEDLLEREIAY